MRARVTSDWWFGLAVAGLGCGYLELLALPAASLRSRPYLLVPAALGALSLAVGWSIAVLARMRRSEPAPDEEAGAEGGAAGWLMSERDERRFSESYDRRATVEYRPDGVRKAG